MRESWLLRPSSRGRSLGHLSCTSVEPAINGFFQPTVRMGAQTNRRRKPPVTHPPPQGGPRTTHLLDNSAGPDDPFADLLGRIDSLSDRSRLERHKPFAVCRIIDAATLQSLSEYFGDLLFALLLEITQDPRKHHLYSAVINA